MDFYVRTIGGKFQEVNIKDGNVTIESGLIDRSESLLLAENLINAAGELLYAVGMYEKSDVCNDLISAITEHLREKG